MRRLREADEKLQIRRMNPHFDHFALNRRAFFGRMSQGLGSLAFASLLDPGLLRAAAIKVPAKNDKWTGVVNPPHFAPKIKRVIWLTMAGGPSHLETFD